MGGAGEAGDSHGHNIRCWGGHKNSTAEVGAGLLTISYVRRRQRDTMLRAPNFGLNLTYYFSSSGAPLIDYLLLFVLIQLILLLILLLILRQIDLA